MNLNPFFKSIVDQDTAPVVICDTEHIIVYMNATAAKRYEYAGGASMVGSSILDCHGLKTREVMRKILAWFMESPDNNVVYEGPGSRENKDVYMVALRDEAGRVIGYYEKHEYHDVETRPKFWPVIGEEPPVEDGKDKPLFFPGCKVRGFYPEGSDKLLAYLEKRFGVSTLGCCRKCYAEAGADDDVIYICNNCHEILGESSEAASLTSVWELIDADESFPFPDYGGKEVTLSDCWIATGNHKVHEAVRSLMGKMNLKVVEMAANRDESRRCGTNIFVPSSANNLRLAPKRWGNLKDEQIAQIEEGKWRAQFESEFAGVATDEVACYCKFCADGIQLGGRKPVHMLDLLFG